jgi:hypothetical protein
MNKRQNIRNQHSLWVQKSCFILGHNFAYLPLHIHFVTTIQDTNAHTHTHTHTPIILINETNIGKS